MDDDEDRTVYQVVLNDEEQYSIWPADRDLPAGWRAEGTVGPRSECLAHIDVVWTDMRPLSLRRFLADQAAAPTESTITFDDDLTNEPLVGRLSRGRHPVEITVRPERTVAGFAEAVERGFVFVRFTTTQGGTELGVRLDREATDLDGADFEAASGSVRVVGDLTLDFEPVRCTAEIELATLAGEGWLTVLDPTAT